MSVVTTLASQWLRGRWPQSIEKQKFKPPNTSGRVVKFSLFKKPITIYINKDLWIRLAFIVLGPSAVLGLSVAYAQILPLRIVFVMYVLPAYLLMLVLGVMYPEWGKRALMGFSAGILATIMYDIVRLILMVGLGLVDPIPHIATLWLGTGLDSNGAYWWVGYLWRFFGNGAGLGVVYAMLPEWFFNMKGGLIYGEFVGTGMLAALFFFPVAQYHLFILNSTSLINGFIGHWAYGLTLGWIFAKSKLVRQFFAK